MGINAEGESTIRAALIGYDRGNPLNIVSFSAIMARLDGQGQPAAPRPSNRCGTAPARPPRRG
ncbi:hypothetical protein I551_2198 [Mycobacterium ulcerans str. Harvey]|uniref:Uncharacterized protein n=1 Tax=Mycobacterium ulcerans str. Harvey TaxID=1299332 RepID=A0ABN0R2M1_MYCUL|nr:hypothetical protein I551_2198 [Mycobacterium ulcerans str. Harvey]